MIWIDIISDTVCPWCFIGKRRLEAAMRQRPDYEYQIGWRPFQLNPELPEGGMERKRYLALKFGGRERAQQIYGRVEAVGREESIDFNFEVIRQQPNTFDSHRLIRWAARAGLQEQVVEMLFQRYFSEGADIGRREILVQIASDCGMDGGEVARLLSEGVDAKLVREEELVARRMGVNGVPCFIVDRKYAVSGAQDATVLVNVFDLAARDQQAPAEPQAAEDVLED